MTLTLTEEDIVRMRAIVLDDDSKDGLVFIKELLKRIDKSKNAGMKSHLDN
jgi:hypothetical protein